MAENPLKMDSETLTRGLTPSDQAKQALRLRRMSLTLGSYALIFLLMLVIWRLKYISTPVLLGYFAASIAIVSTFYLMIRSNRNMRFADPSLTLPQMASSIPTWLYIMYFSGDARGVFLVLILPAFLHGLFRVRAREFVFMAFMAWAGYAILIWLLLENRPSEINLQIEILKLAALSIVLMLVCVLGGDIGHLREKLKEKNIELDKRNLDLQTAVHLNRELASRDELTGVYNRRHLMEMISKEVHRYARHGRSFSICILDVDFFKQVNDSYGHLAGDKVLRSIADTVMRGMRESDCFGRYGGEEFVMVLTDTTTAGALITANRVRQQIETLTFPHISPDLQLTISIGIAQLRPEEDFEHTIKRADDALYYAKQNGRNQCCIAPGDGN